MLAIPLHHGLPAYVDTVGMTKIPVSVFQEKLGPGAFLLWRKLQYCRAACGTTHVTIQTLQEFKTRTPVGKPMRWERQTVDQLKKAFKRLRRAGLVVDGKWVKSKKYPKPLLARTVRGGFVESDRVAVPSSAYPLVLALPTRGGPRPGAGRPSNNQRAHIMTKKSKGTHSNYVTKGFPNSPLLNSLQQVEEKPLCSGSPSSLLKECRRETGLRFGGGGAKAFLDESRLAAPGVPRRPLLSELSSPKVPRPPEVLPNHHDVVKVAIMLQAYAAAHERFGGKRWYGGPRDWRIDSAMLDIDEGEQSERVKRWLDATARTWSKWKNYPAALNAANVMAEKGVRPIEWAQWKLEWMLGDSNRPARFPFFNALFSATQVKTKSGWFRKEMHALGGRSVPTPSYAELMQKLSFMEGALRRSTGPVEPVVERYFPNGLFTELVTAAQSEALESREDYRRAIRHGEWVWR